MTNGNNYIMMVLFYFLLPLFIEAQAIPERAFPPGKVLEKRAAAMVRMGRQAEAIDLYMQALYKNPILKG